jgi:hypothetical protein
MKLLDDYFVLQQQIYDYFGYQEDWAVIPLDDATEYYWQLINKKGNVQFAKTKEDLQDTENYYGEDIYYVYRAANYTMIMVDTYVDGNKFLRVFDNTKEIKGEH